MTHTDARLEVYRAGADELFRVNTSLSHDALTAVLLGFYQEPKLKKLTVTREALDLMSSHSTDNVSALDLIRAECDCRQAVCVAETSPSAVGDNARNTLRPILRSER